MVLIRGFWPWQGHLAMSGDNFGCQNKGMNGLYFWNLVDRDAIKHLPQQRIIQPKMSTVPRSRNCDLDENTAEMTDLINRINTGCLIHHLHSKVPTVQHHAKSMLWMTMVLRHPWTDLYSQVLFWYVNSPNFYGKSRVIYTSLQLKICFKCVTLKYTQDMKNINTV